MDFIKYGVGIDVSMKKFDVCISVIDVLQKVTVKGTSSFANSAKGFDSFKKWIEKHAKLPLPKVLLMEATGIYHEQLAWYLYYKGLPVSVILPTRANKYKQALGLRSKTDGIDAKGLSRMACEQAHTLWNPLSENIYVLRMHTRQIEDLAVAINVFRNQLHALEHGMYRNKELEKMTAKHITMLEKGKTKLEAAIKAIINEDDVLKGKFEKLTSFKGMGMLSAAIIVSELNAFALIENQAQLVSYAGYDVVENQSGKHRGKTKISKAGNGHIRRALHFPALNAVRYNQKPFSDLYERVYKRSAIKMKGYVAVQKKILITLYALWKNDAFFDENKAVEHTQISKGKEAAPSFFSSAGQTAYPVKN